MLLGVYAYFYQAGGWNQNSRFDLVRAVVEHGTWSIDRYEQNTGDDSVRNGRYYSDKAPGAAWLCIPIYWLSHQLAGAPEPVPPDWLAWAVWLSITLAIGVPSAIAATFLARLAGRLGLSPPAAFAVALLWSLGTMALPYSTLLYGNQLAGSLALIAFTLLVEARQARAATPMRMLVVGLLLGYAVVAEYPAVLLCVPIAIYGLLTLGVRSARFSLIGGLVPIAFVLVYHWALFGSPTAFPYNYSVWETHKTGWFMGIGGLRPAALISLLFGKDRGLFFGAPWLIAALPGALALRGRAVLAEASVCLAAVLGFLWLNASIQLGDGGWAPGPRYLVPSLPFWSALAGGVLIWLLRKREQRAVARNACLAMLVLFGVLGLYSAASMFAATAVKPEIPTHHVRPYAQFVWPNFLAGELGASTQSIDMYDNPENAPRQAWNIGMKAGLTGQASLVPLYIWVAAGLAWLAASLAHARRPTPSSPGA